MDPALLVPKKLDAKTALQTLTASRRILEGFAERSDEENERLFRETAEEMGIKLGDLLMPLRVAVTGSASSPPLFGSIRLLGVERSAHRVDAAIKLLNEG